MYVDSVEYKDAALVKTCVPIKRKWNSFIESSAFKALVYDYNDFGNNRTQSFYIMSFGR